jgi:hypothetical protein
MGRLDFQEVLGGAQRRPNLLEDSKKIKKSSKISCFVTGSSEMDIKVDSYYRSPKGVSTNFYQFFE